MTPQFNLLDIIVLAEDSPKSKLRRGSMGTIIEVFDGKDVFLVEFSDDNGVAYATEFLKPAQLIKVFHAPLAA